MATGTGEWQGSQLSIGSSGAYRYVNIWESTFNQSTGVTTIKLNIGTYVNWGNFGGSIFQSWGTPGDQSFAVYGEDTYDVHTYTFTVAHNGSRRFQEGCGYTSASAGGWVESTLDFTWYPTLPTYTVSYNANGGSGAPSSQSKKWGASLTISSVKPSRNGYNFKGWATSKARADAGTVDYASGATYNANAAASLYAVWQVGSYTITYNPNGAVESAFTQTKTYNVPITLATSGFTRANHTLLRWDTSANGGGTSYALGATYSTNAKLNLYAIWIINAPSAPSSFNVTRVSDSQATLSWSRPSDADATWEKVYVYRSTDGGEYAEIANVAGTATSYSDEATTENHYYSYRIRAYNSGGGGQWSAYATQGGYIYNTPAAPTSATAARIDSAGTGVVIYLTNLANTATGFEVECSADGETWASSGITVDSTVGDPVTEIDLTMASGGSYYYRVRNTRSTLKSGWAVTNLVVTIVPPNPPTLVAPSSGSVVAYGSASGTTVDFQWTHNPLDGSPQSAAQLRYSVDGGATWVATIQLTTAQSYSLTHAFALNDNVTWQVRTKGVADDYGDWASSSTFAIYKSPSLSISAPTGTIVGVPVNYQLSYSDDSGQFASGTVSVYDGNALIYSEPLEMPTAGTIVGAIYPSEFLPVDGKTYTFKFAAASNTTLTTTAQVSIPVDMEAPYIGKVQVTNDPDTGYASVVYGWDSSAGGQPVASATLYRISNGVRKQLATTTTNDASCLDMYAPLNTDYTYLVVTVGVNEAINQYEKVNRLDTGYWFAYYGDGKIAKAKWNPNGSRTVSRPERTRVHYIGRKDPVSYDGTAVDDESSIEWRVVEREYALAFLDMVREIGRGVYKSGVGEVYHADFDSASVSSDFHKNQPYGTLTLPIVRIDGDAL